MTQDKDHMHMLATHSGSTLKEITSLKNNNNYTFPKKPYTIIYTRPERKKQTLPDITLRTVVDPHKDQSQDTFWWDKRRPIGGPMCFYV